MLLDAARQPVAFHEIVQLRRIELAVCAGQGQHLVAVRFHRAGFMGGNVAAVGGNHPLPRAEDAGDDSGIGLRAADEKMHVHRLIADECADGCPRGVAVGVEAVAGGLFEVGRGERVENRRVAAREVIVAKLRHEVLRLGLRGDILHTG